MGGTPMRTAPEEFSFHRGDLFFPEMMTLALSVIGYSSLIDRLNPDAIPRGMSLGGIVLGGTVQGSILKDVRHMVADVKGGRQIGSIVFEPNPFDATRDPALVEDNLSRYVSDVAAICVVSAYSSVLGKLISECGKPRLGWHPLFQYLRHIRNAAAHGNRFEIWNLGKKPGIDPNQPPNWRTSIMGSVKEMNRKPLFPQFLRLGDVPVLLNDVSNKLKT